MSQLDSANFPADQLDPVGDPGAPGLSSASAAPAAPAPTQKQRINVYTMMLVIAFIAMCIACTLMYLELDRFGNYPYWRTQEADPRPVSMNAIEWPSHLA